MPPYPPSTQNMQTKITLAEEINKVWRLMIFAQEHEHEHHDFEKRQSNVIRVPTCSPVQEAHSMLLSFIGQLTIFYVLQREHYRIMITISDSPRVRD